MSDQPNGTLRAFDPELIFANPYQHHSARRFRGPEFDEFVESIRVNGVHQPPPARLHPDVSGTVQLQMGHRRLAAWRITHPGEPFTVIVKSIPDLEMFEGCAEENFQRVGLNDIERAELIEIYKKLKPDATNADMARVFRLKDPASISNIRKLLKLPAAIQQHVANNALPDALARQLVGVAAVNPKAAQKIADAVAEASKSEKQDTFEQMTRDLYWNQLTDLEREHGWSLDWLADAPVTIEADLGDGDHMIGACGGCVFNVNNKCARRACFNEKFKLWAAAEVQRVAAKKQIAIAGPDEQTTVLFTGEYHDDDRAQELLNARKEIKKVLRLAPLSEPSKRYSPLLRVFDSNAVTLVTTDKVAIDAYFTERNAASKSKSSAALSVDKDAESDAERAKRIEREKKEMDAKRAARSTQWKSKYDAIWLVQNAAKFIAPQLDISGDFLKFVEAVFCKEFHASHGGIEISALAEQMKKAIQNAADEIEEEDLRKRRIVFNVICDINILNDSGNMPDFKEAHHRIESLLELKSNGWDKSLQGFGATLPEGWDVPPVHKTAFNCWYCGRFAGNMGEKLTQRDISEDGWIDDGKAGVFCSQEHKDAYLAAAQSDDDARPRTPRKLSPMRGRASEEHHAKPNKAQRTKAKSAKQANLAKKARTKR